MLSLLSVSSRACVREAGGRQPTNGIKPMNRERLIATRADRWCLAQLPDRFRENNRPRFVVSLVRVCTSL
jgi:hypothetical protein